MTAVNHQLLCHSLLHPEVDDMVIVAMITMPVELIMLLTFHPLQAQLSSWETERAALRQQLNLTTDKVRKEMWQENYIKPI